MKKILVFCLFIMMTLIPSGATINVKADTYASLLGFNVTDTNFTKVKWLDTEYIEVFGTTTNGTEKYGTAMVDVGYYEYTATDAPSGYDFYVVLVRVIMDPEQYDYSCGLFGWNTCHDVGASEYLEFTSDLQYYSSGSNNILQQATPETAHEPTEYTVGAGVTYNSNGELQYGISGSVSFSDNRLIVRGISDFYNNTYNSTYDYKSPVWPWDDQNYDKDPSPQRGVYLIKVPEGQSWVSNLLEIRAKFEMSIPGPNGNIVMWKEVTDTYYSGDIAQ